MSSTPICATAACGLVFALAASPALAAAPGITRTAQPSRTAHPAKSSALITVLSEGGTTAATAYRAWFDYYGVAIPGDAQGAPGGNPLDSTVQFLLGAVGAGAAQNDIQNQQSGWNATTPSTPPNFNGSPVYNGVADTFLTTCPAGTHDITQCGFTPTAGKALETRGGTTSAGNSTTPDSITHGDGTPWDLASLAAFNNSNGQASGYNLQRGPLLQIPLSAFSISIVFNATGLTVPAGQSGIQLSRNSVCGIFEGHITNWNDPSITSDNGGNTIGNQPITVEYRSDSAGTTFVLSYGLYVACAQTNVQPANAWADGVGTVSEKGPISGPPPTNTVVFPSNSTGSKGNGGVASAVSTTAGAIGYVGTSYVSKAGGNEAFIQNQSGNYVQATVANIRAAIASGPYVKSTQTSEIPPGFPYIKNAYIPLPTASNAAPFVSYDFGYFYTCYPERQLNQISKLHAVYKWALTKEGGDGLTAADSILEANALVELPDKPPKTGGAAKSTSQSTIAGLGVYSGSHSGTYVDPTTGNTLPYTCNPLQ
jgi:ABC-type phosphate transport system substrate-binding protein